MTHSKTILEKMDLGLGGAALVCALEDLGANHVSMVPGESFLPVIDALRDSSQIHTMTCRHESGAAFAAEAQAKLTGLPGICFVTRGPGACNAAIGLHTAMQDSTPLILFVGLVPRNKRGREAFQEIVPERFFMDMSKWTYVIDSADRIGEIVRRAYHTALSGRPGPVVIGLPEDVLYENAHFQNIAPVKQTRPSPSMQDIQSLNARLAQAGKPVCILGGPGWDDGTVKDMEDLAGQLNLPILTSFRRCDLTNPDYDGYGGDLGTALNPRLREHIHQADLIIAIGARLNDIATQGYGLLSPDSHAQPLVHIHADADTLNSYHVTDLALQAHPQTFIRAWKDTLETKLNADQRAKWCHQIHHDYVLWSAPDSRQKGWQGADMTHIFDDLQKGLAEDAIITTDAGNFNSWVQRYLKIRRPQRFLGPISGAMGYAVPAATGACHIYPEREVVALAGDGGFMMTGNELATAIHYGLKPIIIVFNNSMYGTIYDHQGRHFPGREYATTLTNPDFSALGQSFGIFSQQIQDAGDFSEALNEARASGTAALLEVIMDPRQLRSDSTP